MIYIHKDKSRIIGSSCYVGATSKKNTKLLYNGLSCKQYDETLKNLTLSLPVPDSYITDNDIGSYTLRKCRSPEDNNYVLNSVNY